MLGIIASNFLKLGNSLTIVEKYAATVVHIETHCFPQFVENSRSNSDACSISISSKKTHLLNKKGIDNSTENMSRIMDDHEN